MHRKQIYCAGTTSAVRYAKSTLQQNGFTFLEEPAWNTEHLLLDIPSFEDHATLRGGGSIDTLLSSLPKDITVWGGNLAIPATAGYRTIDFLKDEAYLTKNAAITADCALQIAAPALTATWQDSPALVIGWGRIGKCLSRLLRSIGNDVTVAARSPQARATLESLGYHAVSPQRMHEYADKCRILFNTAPEPVIREADTDIWKHCIKIDLASKKGIAGEDVIWAKGLPGIHAPESSGKLIAETFIRLWKEMEV